MLAAEGLIDVISPLLMVEEGTIPITLGPDEGAVLVAAD